MSAHQLNALQKRSYATSSVLCIALVIATATAASAQRGAGTPTAGGAAVQDTTGAGGPPDLRALIRANDDASPLRVALQHLNADRAALSRRYDIPLSPVLHARVRTFYDQWERALSAIDSTRLNAAGRADLATMRARIEAGRNTIRAEERERGAVAPLLPFLRTLQQLQERRRDRMDIDPMVTAQSLTDVVKEVRRLNAIVASDTAALPPELRAVQADAALAAARLIAPRAAGTPGGRGAGGPGGQRGGSELRAMLDDWFSYYNGYDPLFTWWAKAPWAELQSALDAYSAAITKRWRRPVS